MLEFLFLLELKILIKKRKIYTANQFVSMKFRLLFFLHIIKYKKLKDYLQYKIGYLNLHLFLNFMK